ncbi:hypothetical protein CR513_11943, partial [Mucuna pruriens]
MRAASSPSAQGTLPSTSSISSEREGFPFSILNRAFEKSDFLGEQSVHESHSKRFFKGVSPCRSDEPICEGLGDDGPFVYLYDTLPLKLGIQLPFMQFEQVVLCTLNITPTQLHPNRWGALIKCFLLVFLAPSVQEGQVVLLEQPTDRDGRSVLSRQSWRDWPQPSGGLLWRSLLPSLVDLPTGRVGYDREGRFGGMGVGVRSSWRNSSVASHSPAPAEVATQSVDTSSPASAMSAQPIIMAHPNSQVFVEGTSTRPPIVVLDSPCGSQFEVDTCSGGVTKKRL